MKPCLPFLQGPSHCSHGKKPRSGQSGSLLPRGSISLSPLLGAPFLGQRSHRELRDLCQEARGLPGLWLGDGKARLLFQASLGATVQTVGSGSIVSTSPAFSTTTGLPVVLPGHYPFQRSQAVPSSRGLAWGSHGVRRPLVLGTFSCSGPKGP